MPSRIVHAAAEFEREVRQLKRRFPRFSEQVRMLTLQLRDGDPPGDIVPRMFMRTYKVRLPNPSARRGKSGGFRIYYAVNDNYMIFLVTIYSKTDRDDVSTYEVQQRIKHMDRELSGNNSGEP